MTRTSIKMSLAGLGSLLATTAFAADLGRAPVYKAPPPVEAPWTWTGFYVGVGGGYGSANTDVDLTPGPALVGLIPGTFLNVQSVGSEGGFFSVNVGADYQFANNFVVGAFFDYDFMSMESKMSLAVPVIGLTANSSAEIEHQWSVGGRLGYLSSPMTLWYVSGGYSRLSSKDITLNATAPLFGAFATTIGVPEFDGWFVGGGVEAMLTRNISIKAEYRYHSYDAAALTLPTFGGVNLNNFLVATAEPHVQTARVSLNWRFNPFYR